MASYNELLEKAKVAAGKAAESVKALDAGVALTKAQDAVASLDLAGKKQAVIDFIDGPEVEKLKGIGRTVKDFLGVPALYAQSVPGMIRDFAEKLKK